MTGNDYSFRVRIGKSGREVHAARKVVTDTRKIAGRVEEVYHFTPACTVVNTHNVNRHPVTYELPDTTPITCAKCLKLQGDRS